ncbi:hypothetical protein V6N11_047219 [Hibiscus sabdariffa]|uniref:Wings apart-like protein C-terminal domain-containing protein n=1 Tax=Hibiscus sabdariffa TaxID=183260 RepID=A0ABR1ZL49_9ROSI
MPWISSTSSLMEAQEFGEMVEHVDEVDFTLNGLKSGQPVRIRRASLLSLLSISATAPQRRLLRTHGYKLVTVRKTGGNFKEKLRERGGLDAVFEVAMECHSVMECEIVCCI